MEGQLQRTHDQHRHQEDPHHHAGLQSVMEGEGEAEHNHNQNQHGGEKKSVLTKVKDKAKKIKDKIKHAGHAHDDDDYDHEEDEETVNRSDLHPAPIVNESAFISGTALPKQTGLNLENPTVPLEDRVAPTASDEAYDDVRNVGVRNDEMYSDDPFMNTSSLPVQSIYNPNTTTQDADRLPTPFESEQRAYVADPTVTIGPLGGFEEDPHGPGPIPPSNYQSKVTDPTGRGGEEADVTPLLRRLDNPHVDDESQRKTESYTTGGEQTDVTDPVLKRLDNFHVDDESQRKNESYTTGGEEVDVTPLVKRLDDLHVDDGAEPEEMDYTGSHDQFAPATEQFNPKSFDEETPETMPHDTVAGKISAATSVITDKAAAAKNAVASKLGYGGSALDQQEEEAEEVDRPQRAPLMDSVSEYGHRVAEQLAPVYEKAAGAGSAIMSKVQGRGGGEEGGDKGVSVQGYLVEKLRPGEEDRELSKVITEAIQRRGGEEQQPVKETVTVEAVAADEKAAAGVVGRVKGAIGSWLGKKGEDGGGLEKEITSKLQE